MTAQMPLPVLQGEAVPIGGAAGLMEGDAGGVVFLHGNAIFAWDELDTGARRWAAVQLARIGAAKRVQIAAGFGVSTGTLWRWEQAFDAEGLAGVAPVKPGPKRASKLTPSLVDTIRGLDAGGATLAEIATAVGVSTFSVRNALGRVPAKTTATGPAADRDVPGTAGPTSVSGDEPGPSDREDDEPDEDAAAAGDADAADETGCPARVPGDETTLAPHSTADADADGGRAGGGGLPVCPDVVARRGERALARTGLLEEAAPVFTGGAKYPLAGLLLILPALVSTGLLEVAAQVYGKLRNGFYGLNTVLLEATFRALLGEARAEGATRIPPPALGRILGLDRGPEVKTIRRKLAELAGRAKATELVAGMAARHAANHPTELGFLYADGHVRVYQGTRRVQKTHVARLRFPAPATLETWINDAAGAPVFVVLAEPSASLASELRRLIPDLQALAAGRTLTVGFDRGGWSPGLFADLISAGLHVLTYRKGAIPDLDPAAFTTAVHTDEYRREHTYTLADTTIALNITDGGRKGQTLTLRQVTKREANGHQVHVLTSRLDLTAAEVAYRMFSRWRQENYFRYARMHFELDSHDSYTATPDDPDRTVPNPAKKITYAAVGKAERVLTATEVTADADLLELRSPAPGTTTTITNPMLDAINAPVFAARDSYDAATEAHQQVPARIRLGDLAPETMILDTETKLVTHAIRMAAYNAQTALARALIGIYGRADHEAYSLIREALTGAGDIHPDHGVLHVRLEPLSAPRRTNALAVLCEQLNATQTRYPGTDLVLHYQVKPHQ